MNVVMGWSKVVMWYRVAGLSVSAEPSGAVRKITLLRAMELSTVVGWSEAARAETHRLGQNI